MLPVFSPEGLTLLGDDWPCSRFAQGLLRRPLLLRGSDLLMMLGRSVKLGAATTTENIPKLSTV